MEALLISIGVVALAEVGDKTQLLTLILAARYKKPWPIVSGILVATLVNHAMAGVVGAWLTKVLGADAMRWVLGASFIAMAAWMLFPDKLDEKDLALQKSVGGVFLTTTVIFFLVEMGDKTQIATVALAARFESLASVVLGTTIGMIAANAPVAWFGDILAKRLPVRTVRLIAALVFGALGIGAMTLG